MSALLTVITINLNNKQGLTKTLESVRKQSFKDLQLIVVDGLSTDGSIDIIENNRDLIDRAIVEKDNGIYNAMNKGIKLAEGEYIYFLNAGDILHDSDVLSKVFSSLHDYSFICTNFYTEMKNEIIYNNPYRDRDWSFSLYDIYAGYLCHQAFFIRKSMFEKYGYYNENLKVVSDWLLFFIAIGLNHETVIYKDVDLVVYNAEGLSSTIGGQYIYNEKQEAIKKYISPYLYNRLNQIYQLEQYQYIIDITKKSTLLSMLVRIYGYVNRKLGKKIHSI